MEVGQLLTNLYGLNPDIVVHNQIVTQALRRVGGAIITQGQPDVEPISVIFLIYSNPGDVQGFDVEPEQQVIKANLRKEIN